MELSRNAFPTSALAKLLLPCCNQCYLEGRAQCYLLVEESKVDTDELKYDLADIVELKGLLGKADMVVVEDMVVEMGCSTEVQILWDSAVM